MAGLRVVEIGGGAVGPRVGRLFADQGAEVLALRPAGAEPSDWAGWDRGKAVSGDAPDAFVARADVLIDAGPVAWEGPVHPATVHCRIDGGGDLPATEGLVAAATGLYEVPLGRRPRFHTLPLATFLGALFAANGVMAALHARRRDGRGQRVDVSLTDAALGAHELFALFTDRPPTAWNPLQWAGSPFIAGYGTAEGTVYVHLGLASHLARLLDRLGAEGEPLRRVCSEATLRDPGAVGSVFEAARIRRALQALFVRRSAEAWEALLAPAGLCVVRVRTPIEWRESAHARASGIVDGEGLGPAVRVGPIQRSVVDPHRWGALPEPTGDDRRPPLAGVDVLDFTQVIAGPVAGRVLAELGARVVRVDNPWFRPAFVDAFHAVFDRGKQGVWLDLAHPGGQAGLARLVDALRPSVVIENFRPGKAAALGIDGLAPVHVSISAFGANGPWGGWAGWEQTAQAACGVQADYGGDRPELFPAPVHDLATGLLGAFGALVALYAGSGRVEASLAATSTWLQAPRLFGGRLPEDGWTAGGGWRFRANGREVTRVKPAAALARSGRARRASLAGVGELTCVGSPVRLSRTPTAEGEPEPRGADTAAWLGVESPDPSARPPSRAAWWLDRARWGVWAVLTR